MAARRTYAQGTSVSVEKSEAELKAMLRKAGADAIGFLEQDGQVQCVFRMNRRQVLIRLSLPSRDESRFHVRPRRARGSTATLQSVAYARWEQACRERWRALLLCVRAKLESVASGIETFDQAFLAHVMLPGGETFGDWADRPENLRGVIEGAPMRPMLMGPAR